LPLFLFQLVGQTQHDHHSQIIQPC